MVIQGDSTNVVIWMWTLIFQSKWFMKLSTSWDIISLGLISIDIKTINLMPHSSTWVFMHLCSNEASASIFLETIWKSSIVNINLNHQPLAGCDTGLIFKWNTTDFYYSVFSNDFLHLYCYIHHYAMCPARNIL